MDALPLPAKTSSAVRSRSPSFSIFAAAIEMKGNVGDVGFTPISTRRATPPPTGTGSNTPEPPDPIERPESRDDYLRSPMPTNSATDDGPQPSRISNPTQANGPPAPTTPDEAVRVAPLRLALNTVARVAGRMSPTGMAALHRAGASGTPSPLLDAVEAVRPTSPLANHVVSADFLGVASTQPIIRTRRISRPTSAGTYSRRTNRGQGCSCV